MESTLEPHPLYTAPGRHVAQDDVIACVQPRTNLDEVTRDAAIFDSNLSRISVIGIDPPNFAFAFSGVTVRLRDEDRIMRDTRHSWRRQAFRSCSLKHRPFHGGAAFARSQDGEADKHRQEVT